MILENESLFMLAGFQIRRKKRILLGQIPALKLLYSLPLGQVLCSDINPPTEHQPEPFWPLGSEVTWKDHLLIFFIPLAYELL